MTIVIEWWSFAGGFASAFVFLFLMIGLASTFGG